MPTTCAFVSRNPSAVNTTAEPSDSPPRFGTRTLATFGPERLGHPGDDGRVGVQWFTYSHALITSLDCKYSKRRRLNPLPHAMIVFCFGPRFPAAGVIVFKMGVYDPNSPQ